MQKQITSQKLMNLIGKKLMEIPDEYGIPTKVIRPKVEIVMLADEFNKFVRKLMRYYKVIQADGYLYAYAFINVDNEYFMSIEIKIYYQEQNGTVKLEKIILYKGC